MSIHLSNTVWKYSRQQKSGALVVLLAIADYANADGIAWPAVPTLARKVRMSKRNVQRWLSSLQRDRELKVLRNEGRRGVNIYKICLPLDNAKRSDADGTGDTGVARPVTRVSSTNAASVIQSFVPVFVRNGNGAGPGNSALLQRGARLWPEPGTSAELDRMLTDASDAMLAEPKQEKLSFNVKEEAPPTQPPPSKHEQTMSPADRLFETVESILTSELAVPHSETQVMKILGVSKAQTKKWLQQLVERGAVEKLKKPVRYRAVGTAKLL